jgi:hypothetical protein
MTDLRDDELTVDGLTSGWTMVQRKRGHRHSTDDLLTGWYAAECVRGARRILDLGAGIGSVGLLALWRSPGATLTSIEAQELSFALLERNVAANALGDRVRAIYGDLREISVDAAAYDLVTGSPPYFDPKDGVVPADSQKAHARFELRGDVFDYCLAARSALSPSGRFVFCFPWAQRVRAERAIDCAGLALVSSRDVIPREGAAPLFSLFCCAYDGRGVGEPLPPEPYLVRDALGRQTPMHAATRATFGFFSADPEVAP